MAYPVLVGRGRCCRQGALVDVVRMGVEGSESGLELHSPQTTGCSLNRNDRVRHFAWGMMGNGPHRHSVSSSLGKLGSVLKRLEESHLAGF